VSTALPTGVPWVNQDGADRLVVAPGDPDALRAALAALAASPDCAAIWAAGARARALATFTAEQMCDGAYEVYRDAAAAALAGAPDGARCSPSGRSTWRCPALGSGIGARVGRDRRRHQTRRRRAGVLPAGALRTERCAVSGVEIPLDDSDAEAVTGAVQSGEHDTRVTRSGG
jgi:hypothetical protein